MSPPDPPQDTADDEQAGLDRPSARPALPRGHTFRNTLSPKQSRLSSNMSSSAAPPPRQPRAALPRAGTFKLAKTGPPPPVGGSNSGAPVGDSHDSASVGSSGDGSVVASRSGESAGRSALRASLPRGHTFRAPRREISDIASPVDSNTMHRSREGKGKASLPRAGTFAFGAGAAPGAAAELERARNEARAKEHAAAEDADLFRKMPSDADLKGVLDGGRSSCGMCGNCAGVSGIGGGDGGSSSGGASSGSKGSGMPPWAPERLALLNDSERNVVIRKMQAKEELGRLDRDLREKQVKDRILREQRAKKADGVTNSGSRDVVQAGNVCHEDASRAGVCAASVSDDDGFEKGASDLEDEVTSRRSRTTRKHKGAKKTTNAAIGPARNDKESSSAPDLMQDPERIALDVDVEQLSVKPSESEPEVMSGVELDTTEMPGAKTDVCDHRDSHGTSCEPVCGLCDVLESKVRDLEEQLDVLRGVVSISHGKPGSGDGTSEDSLAKKSSWKSKVMNAYYGSGGTPSVERARLKEEVEALRKATDFLFAKLQEADSRPGQHFSEYGDAQLD